MEEIAAFIIVFFPQIMVAPMARNPLRMTEICLEVTLSVFTNKAFSNLLQAS